MNVGWHKVGSRYSTTQQDFWNSVVFMKPLPSIQIVKLRKFTDCVSKLKDSPALNSNLIVEWIEFNFVMNRIKSSSDPFQMKNISSINLRHKWGSISPILCHSKSINNSSIPMKIHANVGLLRLPIATPGSWRKRRLSKVNTFEDARNHQFYKEFCWHCLVLPPSNKINLSFNYTSIPKCVKWCRWVKCKQVVLHSFRLQLVRNYPGSLGVSWAGEPCT